LYKRSTQTLCSKPDLLRIKFGAIVAALLGAQIDRAPRRSAA
jgi:hypothetical protein